MVVARDHPLAKNRDRSSFRRGARSRLHRPRPRQRHPALPVAEGGHIGRWPLEAAASSCAASMGCAVWRNANVGVGMVPAMDGAPRDQRHGDQGGGSWTDPLGAPRAGRLRARFAAPLPPLCAPCLSSTCGPASQLAQIRPPCRENWNRLTHGCVGGKPCHGEHQMRIPGDC